jgi:hypothetical protein
MTLLPFCRDNQYDNNNNINAYLQIIWKNLQSLIFVYKTVAECCVYFFFLWIIISLCEKKINEWAGGVNSLQYIFNDFP